MSKIIAIGTAVPAYCHEQEHIRSFMENVYAMNEVENRKLRFLYRHSGIRKRYSVLPDYSLPAREWTFYPETENLEPFPGIAQRMKAYDEHALPLSLKAIKNCLPEGFSTQQITHLITVSCTGMKAPGLDIELVEALELPPDCERTSVNFMGCYAAIHALKLADAFLAKEPRSNVLIVCTELCTLHFQKDAHADSIASSLLFGDGAAAVLVAANNHESPGLTLHSFHSEIAAKGKQDMSWNIGDTGFLMTLSSYVPQLIETDIRPIVERGLKKAGWDISDIHHWCIHPGGPQILNAVAKSMSLKEGALKNGYDVLAEYGNMSSPTLLFVLEKTWNQISAGEKILAAAFGPGLTIETFTAEK